MTADKLSEFVEMKMISESNTSATNIADALEQELQKIRQEHLDQSNDRFVKFWKGRNLAGCGLLQFKKARDVVDPLHLVGKLFDQIQSGQQTCLPLVVRIIPFQMTCYSSLEEITPCVKGLFKQKLSGLPPGLTYRIETKTRKSQHLPPDVIIGQLAPIVREIQPTYCVEIKDPDITILFHVLDVSFFKTMFVIFYSQSESLQ
jgi:hypothetical protein